MSISPKVSIIILNWNGLKDTIECLESVVKIDYPNYDIIVVDNASADGSPEKIVKLFPNVQLIKNNENLGYAGGNNVGIQYAISKSADYVWVLNNDTVVRTDSLSRLVVRGESSSKIGLLSPILSYYSDPSRIQFCGAYLDLENLTLKQYDKLSDLHDDSRRELLLWGTALLIKKDVIDRIGLFNEKYYAYWEDIEYSLRALRAGFINEIVQDSALLHKVEFMPKEEIRKKQHYYYYTARNEYYFWMTYLRIGKKIAFLRKYVSKKLKDAILFRKLGYDGALDSLLDGMLSAFTNRGGKHPDKMKGAKLFKSFLLAHPYFICNLVDGDFKNMLVSNIQKTKKAMSFNAKS